ncbi:hypothetical protein C8Q75DRAFT_456220 [Abortiporus biennis]|nr:hypothetical protein C8Q75DRAFT_456220 [Abortiporus biennis]
MNVLVYSGPEVLQTSLTRSISLLRSFLLPNYTVQPITSQSLCSQPWSETCALLVFPAFQEQPSFSSSVSNLIRSYVENGGALLGIRSTIKKSKGGSLGLSSSLAGLTLGSSSEYSLRFTDKSSGSNVYCTFLAGGDQNGRTVSIKSDSQGDLQGLVTIIEDGTFTEVDENAAETQVLARYSEGDKTDIAGVKVRIGEGRGAFWSVDIDAPVNVGDNGAEQKRRKLFQDTLRSLGLKLPTEEGSATPILPQFLTSVPSKPKVINHILKELSVQTPGTLKDESDTFSFHEASSASELLHSARSSSTSNPQATKEIIVYTEGKLPPSSETPLFNIEQYYTALADVRKEAGCKAEAYSWGIGEVLLYGEVVTSTQTMLDKNHGILCTFPPPLLSLASQQTSGRGRGGNTWVSPSGCLQFSLLLRASLSELSAAKLVFIQYLFGLAVVEACRNEQILGEKLGEKVRLKWPNDVYAIMDDGSKKKIGGVLIHTSFMGGTVYIVIGAGLNVLNEPPIASLSQLIPSSENSSHKLTMEKTAATIMATFESMWDKFLAHRGSFDPFLDLYLERWLHSDQRVTITSVTPHRSVRIVGITDHGLLRTLPERGGHEFIDLQPDGNSFDLMSGLIMTKS